MTIEKIPITIPFYRFIKRNKPKDIDKQLGNKSYVPEFLLIISLFLSLFYWPVDFNTFGNILVFVLWIAILVLFFVLTMTNIRTMMLPDIILKWLMLAIIVFQLTKAVQSNDSKIIFSAFIGSIILGGALYILFQVTKGKWVGGGDVKLGFVAGLLLGWELGIICLAVYALLFLAIIIYGSLNKGVSSFPSGPIWTISILSCFIIGNKFLV